MQIICISRGSYGYGNELADSLAAKLGYDCIARESLTDSATDEGIGLFLGNGDGAWEKAPDTGLPTNDNGHEIALADYNHDGILEIAASMMRKPNVWLSRGDGKWEASSEGIPEPSWGGQYWGASTADVNNDGHPTSLSAIS